MTKQVALAAALVLLAGCQSLPPLVSGLPPAFEEARPILTERLLKVAPLGSPEGRLIDELHRQQFVVDPKARFAPLTRALYPCDVGWMVRWDVDGAGRLTRIEGDTNADCP